MRVDHPVQEASSIPARVDPTGETQLGEVLADARLCSADGGDERADVDLGVGQFPQQVQPARGAEELKDLGGIVEHAATVFLLLLYNDRGVLGPWVNRRGMNVFSGAVIAILVMLSTVLTASVLFPAITSTQIIAVFAAGTALTLVAGGYLVWSGRHHKDSRSADARAPALDRATWRMPPLALLTKPVLSAGSRTGLTVLRGYLLLASALVVVKVVQLALGS